MVLSEFETVDAVEAVETGDPIDAMDASEASEAIDCKDEDLGFVVRLLTYSVCYRLPKLPEKTISEPNESFNEGWVAGLLSDQGTPEFVFFVFKDEWLDVEE